MRSVVALLFVVSGCVRANLLECGDKLCSSQDVCLVDRCVDRALVCEQAGTECDALGVPGRCIEGVCEVATCGDGYVDAALREDCDNSVPATHCVDVGFDLGRPGCSDCQSDLLAGCVSFGWKLAVNSPAEKLWTDGQTFAYWRFEPSSLEIEGPGIDISRAFVSIYEIRGGGGRIVVDGLAGPGSEPDTLDIVNGQVAALIPPPGVDVDSIAAFDVTDDGTLYVLASCKLYSRMLSGSWEERGKVTSTAACAALEVDGGRTFVVDTSNAVWALENGSFVRWFSLTSTIHQLAYTTIGGIEALWLASNSGLAYARARDSAPTFVFTDGRITSLAVADGLVYGAVEGTDADTTLVRWDGRSIGKLLTPGNKAITAGGDRVYGYRGPIYEFSGVDFSKRLELGPLALQEQPVDVLEPPSRKGIAVVTTFGLHIPDANGTGWTQIQGTGLEPNSVRAAGGNPDLTVFSAYLAATELDRRPTLAIAMLESGASTIDVPGAPLIHGLWVAPDNTIYAVGDDDAGRGFRGIRSPAAVWSVFSPPGSCTILSVHALVSTYVLAAGACDGQAVLWRHDGTDWSELQRFPTLPTFAAVKVLGPSQIAAVGPTAVARFDGTSWWIDETVNGSVIAGTLEDLWVSGSFTTVQRFDGASWSRMTTRALQPIHVVVDGRRVLLPGAAPGFAELLR